MRVLDVVDGVLRRLRLRASSMSKSISTWAAREAKNQRAASVPTASSRSSSVTNVPARFDIETSTPSATNRTQPIEQHLVVLRVVAHRLGGVLVAGDGPVVVDAPDVDQVVEPAAELLGHVADVGREVRRPTVGAVDHAVLVVAEGGRAEPGRAVLLVDVAAVAQPLDRALDPALVVERRLALPDVEPDAEPGEARPRSIARTRRDAQAPSDRRGVRAGGGRLGPDVVRHLGARAPRRRRPCSRPRGPARRAARPRRTRRGGRSACPSR